MFRIFAVVAFLLLWVYSYGMPNRNPVVNADGNGFARFTKIDFKMDERDSLRMFYLEFTTNSRFEPGGFGAFWHMPVFSSHITLSKSNSLSWYAPNGATYLFCAHSAEKKGRRIESFIDSTSTWRAVKKKSGYDIVSLKDGSTFTYDKGQLTGFMLKDKRKYDVIYRSGDNNVVSVKEKSGGNVLSFEYHKDGRHVKSVTTYLGTFSFEYHPRKSGDILGTDNFYGNALLLGKIEYPGDRGVEEFEYSKPLSRSRGILLKDLTEITTSPLSVKKMAMRMGDEEKGWIEWCSVTGLIMADNGGKYSIGSDGHDSFFPNFKPGQGNAKFSAVKYTTPNMPYPQIHLFDYDNYYEIKGNPSTGEIVRNLKIGACGSLKMKTRKVEKLVGTLKAPEWVLEKTYLYDNFGKLFRELDRDGNEYTPKEVIRIYLPLIEREAKVALLLNEIEREDLSDYGKAELFLHIAAVYHYHPDWKPDLKQAISTYEKVLNTFPMEPVIIAKSYCMLASAHTELKGQENRKIALGYLKQLYGLDLSVLSEMQKESIIAEQNGAYKLFLSLQESGDYLKDIDFIKQMKISDARNEIQEKIADQRVVYLERKLKNKTQNQY